MDFSAIFSTEGLIAFLTLSLLEIVLGIDNIIFISILTNKLPKESQSSARISGISLALVFRVAMLFGITWIIQLTEPLFTIMDMEFTGRDLVLLAGGLFLLAKSTSEIHHKMEGEEHHEEEGKSKVRKGLAGIIIQIALLDIVFSFDSILTAIGMTQELGIMILAVIVSLIVMLIFAGKIAAFIAKHPTLQILALSFLILIGVMLIAEGFHQHISKGYIYFAVAFSLIVEIINMRVRKGSAKKSLKKR
ncbi:TerC family protein [Croceimicrobium hydrocarbonivorans]|uniref:TerC family protein n=2 Tax=Croceimicrobium hydrocarbonivorans TaxID=2761580 RepID=A0A7H0VK59_9FLAO|nr:TerC family protein [Croceimicrobium hydrocarbonivorans]